MLVMHLASINRKKISKGKWYVDYNTDASNKFQLSICMKRQKIDSFSVTSEKILLNDACVNKAQSRQKV